MEEKQKPKQNPAKNQNINMPQLKFMGKWFQNKKMKFKKLTSKWNINQLEGVAKRRTVKVAHPARRHGRCLKSFMNTGLSHQLLMIKWCFWFSWRKRQSRGDILVLRLKFLKYEKLFFFIIYMYIYIYITQANYINSEWLVDRVATHLSDWPWTLVSGFMT